MSWSNTTWMLVSGNGTTISSAGVVRTTAGGVKGISTSTCRELAISSRPRESIASASASGPPLATSTRCSVARSTISSEEPKGSPTGA